MNRNLIKGVLETSRLRLRRFKHSDIDAVYKYGSDEQVVKYLDWNGVTTRQQALDIIESYYLNSLGAYAITLKDSDLCIGAIDIRVDEANDKASFGYLLDHDYWNLGYMQEVLTKILEYCFEDLKLNRIEAIHYRTNPASGRVMAKSGMQLEGIGIQELKIKGIYQDVIHYGITKKMWQKR
ncbi:MAG: GNAT family N-acetyltransferase [Thomasclavelia sp.]|uniref:GNAT family N-acetyltransferase n=1 Tax=Thomasclavelia sp. TaxID=3025757 RepID=UPI0039A35430